MYFVNYVYSAPGHMANASDFLCGMYIHLHFPYMFLKDMAYMSSLVSIYVSGSTRCVYHIKNGLEKGKPKKLQLNNCLSSFDVWLMAVALAETRGC